MPNERGYYMEEHNTNDEGAMREGSVELIL